MPKFTGVVRINVPYYANVTVDAKDKTDAMFNMLANIKADISDSCFDPGDYDQGDDIKVEIYEEPKED